ncbi:ribonuclease D [Subtercola boreus]|uniref:Ribonuclease D n=1 Tax=Subtercola boreus TaxID=120213 RepID=A0A3E0WDI9_9MICO|nr:ribonuclease D [Subtercola boreus]RFA20993.1 ribonuclease D [Subtercola boreus]RFA27157.1 ribonuclease D [Subtercola boreus]
MATGSEGPALLSLPLPGGPARDVIDTREGYLEAVQQIAAGTGPLAIDAERASGFKYSQRAYLIQLYRQGAGTFLFDPPPIGSFRELADLISGEEWVLHAASQDLACLREVDLAPTRIFDTELAARLLGMPRVGLGTVVEELLAIHIAKEHSAADWSTRPLPAAWLEYAALDVELLLDVRDIMVGMLEDQGKTEIARQEFQATLDKESKPVAADPWRRLSGVHSLRGAKNLAAARELWLARDALARETDVAPGRLVPDLSLTSAARALPATKRDLAAMRDFTGRASRSELDRWWAAIEVGRASVDPPQLSRTGDTLPPPRSWSERNPEADARLKLARQALLEVSEERRIPIENLLTPELLRRAAWTPPADVTARSIALALETAGARPWQIELTAQPIAQAFVEARQQPTDDVEAGS